MHTLLPSFVLSVVVGLSIAIPYARASAQSVPVVFVESFVSCGALSANGVIAVDKTTGDRRAVVGLENLGASCSSVGGGALPEFIKYLGWDENAQAILVADGPGGSSRVLSIDWVTGFGSVVSGCTSPGPGSCAGSVIGTGALDEMVGDVVVVTGSTASPPALVAGDIVVAMSRFTTCGSGGSAIVRIDGSTGDRTVLSGLADDCVTTIGLGDEFVEVNGILPRDDGTLLIADGDGGIGRLLSVDPLTGDRTTVSGCDDVSGATCVGSILGSGPVPTFAHSVVPLGGAPDVVASRMPLGGCFAGAVLEVDTSTGNRAVLSGEDETCTVVGSGPPLINLEAVAGLPSGDLVVSEDGGIDRISQIDATSGARTVVTGCSVYSGFSCTGPLIGGGATADGYGVLTVPEPSFGAMLLIGAWGLARSRRARRRR